jgi:hypothetical protein
VVAPLREMARYGWRRVEAVQLMLMTTRILGDDLIFIGFNETIVTLCGVDFLVFNGVAD